VFEFLNSCGYDLALQNRVKIRQESDLEEDEQSEPEPKKGDHDGFKFDRGA
jgi:hypothetical protein